VVHRRTSFPRSRASWSGTRTTWSSRSAMRMLKRSCARPIRGRSVGTVGQRATGSRRDVPGRCLVELQPQFPSVADRRRLRMPRERLTLEALVERGSFDPGNHRHRRALDESQPLEDPQLGLRARTWSSCAARARACGCGEAARVCSAGRAPLERRSAPKGATPGAAELVDLSAVHRRGPLPMYPFASRMQSTMKTAKIKKPITRSLLVVLALVQSSGTKSRLAAWLSRSAQSQRL
jgi:hypothetical protein